MSGDCFIGPATKWAFGLRGISSTDKIVLLAMAQHAIVAPECRAGLERLADMAELSDRAVRIALRRLERAELIRVATPRADGRKVGGRGTPTRYVLCLHVLEPVRTEEPERPVRETPVRDAPETRKRVPPNGHDKHGRNPESGSLKAESPSPNPESDSAESYLEMFGDKNSPPTPPPERGEGRTDWLQIWKDEWPWAKGLADCDRAFRSAVRHVQRRWPEMTEDEAGETVVEGTRQARREGILKADRAEHFGEPAERFLRRKRYLDPYEATMRAGRHFLARGAAPGLAA